MKNFISFSCKWCEMKSNIVIVISSLFPYLAKFCFSSYGPKCCWPIKMQVSLKYNISRKKQIMKCIFGMQINIEVFYKLILSFYVCVVRYAQSTQINKFAYLCSRKPGKQSWFFIYKKKQERFLQIDIITLGVQSLPFPKYPK